MIYKIEVHLFEMKNHKVKTEYHIFKDCFTFTIKTKSMLTEEEKTFPKKTIYHF